MNQVEGGLKSVQKHLLLLFESNKSLKSKTEEFKRKRSENLERESVKGCCKDGSRFIEEDLREERRLMEEILDFIGEQVLTEEMLEEVNDKLDALGLKLDLDVVIRDDEERGLSGVWELLVL